MISPVEKLAWREKFIFGGDLSSSLMKNATTKQK